MLLLDSAAEVAGLAVFGDHLAANIFYYLPAAPHPTAGTKPTLLRYRGAHEGGLWLLDVSLGVSPAQLAAAKAELEERLGVAIELVPVLFAEGTARLSALGVTRPEAAGVTGAESEPWLVEHILGAATPSLSGDQRAIFSVDLDREGASLVEAALRGGGLPLVVSHELAFDGLYLARDLRVRIDHRMTYAYLRTQLRPEALVFRADLARETEALLRDGHITLELVEHESSDPSALERLRSEALDTVRELAEALFFRPAASPSTLGAEAVAGSPALDNAWGRHARAGACFVLRELRQDEEQILTYDLRQASTRRVRIAPQGVILAAEGATEILDTSIDDQPAQEVCAFCAQDTDWSGVAGVLVDVRCAAETRSLALSPQQREQRTLLPPGPLEHRIRLLRSAEPEVLGAPLPVERDPPWQPLPARNLAVDPAALAGRRVLEISLGIIDPEVVRAVVGTLRQGDDSRDFLLDAARPATSVVVVGADEVVLAATLTIVDGEPLHVAQVVPTGQRAVVIHQPLDQWLVVTVQLADPLARHEAVLVEIEGDDGAQRRALRLTAASPTARWSLRRSADATRGYRFRERGILRDASIVEGDWRAGPGALLLVGDPQVCVADVDVALVGIREALAIILRMVSLTPPQGVEPTVELLLDPAQRRTRVRLPFQRGARRRYRWDAEIHTEAGIIAIEPRESEDELILLTNPA